MVFPSILASRENVEGVGGNDRGVTGPLRSLPWCTVFAFQKRKKLFFDHVFLFFYAIRYYIRDLMIILYKIVHKIYSLRLFMNKLL